MKLKGALVEVRQLDDAMLKLEVWLKEAEGVCAATLKMDMPLDLLETLARKHQVLYANFQCACD